MGSHPAATLVRPRACAGENTIPVECSTRPCKCTMPCNPWKILLFSSNASIFERFFNYFFWSFSVCLFLFPFLQTGDQQLQCVHQGTKGLGACSVCQWCVWRVCVWCVCVALLSFLHMLLCSVCVGSHQSIPAKNAVAINTVFSLHTLGSGCCSLAPQDAGLVATRRISAMPVWVYHMAYQNTNSYSRAPSTAARSHTSTLHVTTYHKKPQKANKN